MLFNNLFKSISKISYKKINENFACVWPDINHMSDYLTRFQK